MNLSALLTPQRLHIDQLLLDPNNPRFSEIGEGLLTVSEPRFAEANIQKATAQKMRNDKFDVAELRDTIKTIGFLPMDRLVVRKWQIDTDPQKYVVIEGNRRVTALKWLLELHAEGKENLSEEQISNITDFECLVLDHERAPPSTVLVLPGLRHVSGIKEWGPYQKAKTVHALRRSGMTPQEAAQSLGLSTMAANRAYRCFVALENMKSDEEYGERADPRMYSYFEEVFKRPSVRDWLAWSDGDEKFTNASRLSEFYGWMIPGEGDSETAKLPEAKDVRELADIVSDESALSVLRSPEGTLARALARYQVDHPEDWFPKITAATAALKSLTPDILATMDEATVKTLQDLKVRIETSLKYRDKLMRGD